MLPFARVRWVAVCTLIAGLGYIDGRPVAQTPIAPEPTIITPALALTSLEALSTASGQRILLVTGVARVDDPSVPVIVGAQPLGAAGDTNCAALPCANRTQLNLVVVQTGVQLLGACNLVPFSVAVLVDERQHSGVSVHSSANGLMVRFGENHEVSRDDQAQQVIGANCAALLGKTGTAIGVDTWARHLPGLRTRVIAPNSGIELGQQNPNRLTLFVDDAGIVSSVRWF